MNKILIIAAALAVTVSCKKKEEKASQEPAEVSAGAEVIHPESGGFATSVNIPGELQAFQQVDLYAKVTGFVQKVAVDVGSNVAQGQLLAVLEAPEMKAQISAAASRLKAQEALYVASSATYERLAETSKTPGTIATNDLDMAHARQQADLAQLEAAKASYREVSDMQNYLTIRAPFSGNITARNVSPGAYVGPSGKGSEFPLFSLVQQNKLRLVVNLPETYTGILDKSQVITFTVHSLPGETFSGRISRHAGALDTRLRSQRVEIDVENGNKKLLPGMVTNVSLPLSGSREALSVPNTAILNSSTGVYVIRVEKGKAVWVPVSTGIANDSVVLVTGPVNSSNVLVKYASEEIRNGQEVKVRK